MAKIIKLKATLTKKGKPVVLVTTAAKDHWVPWGTWLQSATQDLEAYIGGDFTAFYFAKGDTLIDGSTCTADDTILDSFAASQNPDVAARVALLTAQQKAETMNDAMLMQRRIRNERLAKAKPAVVTE